ncbi:fucolectin-1-like [Xyrichtys novacula]|uniref:Fucolectin-1-like n=1 Tax=Xyrichtys novacula TaxID=13765 RepID=A0AAV1FP75_XYRNO|nr:fucolectin-1-like [Xyrichtys novacula]
MSSQHSTDSGSSSSPEILLCKKRTMKYSSVLLLHLLLGTCAAYNYQNVALRGKATQSTRLVNILASASNAIDGNRDNDYNHGSCTHTLAQVNPWWRVDLLDHYIITSIVVTNRGDCCPERINGAQIHVGNSLRDNGVANPLVGVIPQIQAGRSLNITFTRLVEGRYVTITLTGAGKVLSLCEVEVYGYPAPTGENLALQGQASQSSLHSVGFAYHAIDGNKASIWGQASCSHTVNELNPWWRLDLRRTHRVFSVNITNYWNTATWINGAEIRIGDSLDNNGNNNPRCAVISSIAAGFTENFNCNGMDGRYVNVVIPGRTSYLALCEVEVYGSRLD